RYLLTAAYFDDLLYMVLFRRICINPGDLTTYMFLPLLFFAGFWGGSAHNSKRDHISVPVEDGMDLLVLVYRDHQWTQKKYLLYFHRPVLRVAFERGTCHFQVRGSWNSGNPHEFMLGQNPV